MLLKSIQTKSFDAVSSFGLCFLAQLHDLETVFDLKKCLAYNVKEII